MREPVFAAIRTPHQREAEDRKSGADSKKEELFGLWLEELPIFGTRIFQTCAGTSDHNHRFETTCNYYHLSPHTRANVKCAPSRMRYVFVNRHCTATTEGKLSTGSFLLMFHSIRTKHSGNQLKTGKELALALSMCQIQRRSFLFSFLPKTSIVVAAHQCRLKCHLDVFLLSMERSNPPPTPRARFF